MVHAAMLDGHTALYSTLPEAQNSSGLNGDRASKTWARKRGWHGGAIDWGCRFVVAAAYESSCRKRPTRRRSARTCASAQRT